MNRPDLDLIQKHLAGELTGAEAEAFAERLKGDPEFAEAVAAYLLDEALLGQALADMGARAELDRQTRPAATRRHARVLRRLRPGGASPWWVAGLAAAAAAVVVLYFGATSGGPSRRVAGRRDVARDSTRRGTSERQPWEGNDEIEPRVAREDAPRADEAGPEPEVEASSPPAAPPAPEPAVARVAETPPEPTADVEPASVPQFGYVDLVRGDVERAAGGDGPWIAASAGDPLNVGDRIRTKVSRARVALESGTVVYLNHFTTVTVARADGAYGLTMVGGEVYVDTAPRDKGFWTDTPHGHVVDLGTKFGIDARKRGTSVVVVEGSVEAATDAGAVRVEDNHEAILVSRVVAPRPPRPVRDVATRLAWLGDARPRMDEIVLLPWQGRITGPLFRLVADEKAPSPKVLEAWHKRHLWPEIDNGTWRRASYVTFTFLAEAGREYHIWARANSKFVAAEGEFTWQHDAAGAELLTGVFVTGCKYLGKVGPNWHLVDAMPRSGYGWSPGGVARFRKTGKQVLRIYPVEPPFRIDRIWISTTQAEKPEADVLGPDEPRVAPAAP